MSGRWHWRDAYGAAERLRTRWRERCVLLLLARLPLLPAEVLQRLDGLSGPASVYRCLGRLRQDGLVDVLAPRLRPPAPRCLWYLTDLGLASVAVREGAEPVALARSLRVDGASLLACLPGLPHLVAAYELLGALAASRPGRPDLLAWERPWRRRFLRPTARSEAVVTLPAYAALAWEGGEAAEFLLVPDLATFPLRGYRAALGHLFSMRVVQGGGLPPLLVATEGERRVTAWERLLEELRRARREAPLEAEIVTWEALRDGQVAFEHLGRSVRHMERDQGERARVRPLRPRAPSSPLPQLVGEALTRPRGPSPFSDSLGAAAVGLDARGREFLELVGRHPFLSLPDLRTVLGWRRPDVRRQRDALIAAGLLRPLEWSGPGTGESTEELVELTVAGLKFVAAQQGLSLAAAIRLNGLAGGGPEDSVGARAALVQHLAHTRGADAVSVALHARTRALRETGEDAALVEWRNAAACARRHVRPDGYGILRYRGKRFGFFLEYDRGTMKARAYRRKFAAYYAYRDSGRFAADYEGFPTILVVTTDNAAERRIARAAEDAGAGRWPKLAVLLTTEWRVQHDEDGVLGPIWRKPTTAERRCWPEPSSQRCNLRSSRPTNADRRQARVIPPPLANQPSARASRINARARRFRPNSMASGTTVNSSIPNRIGSKAQLPKE